MKKFDNNKIKMKEIELSEMLKNSDNEDIECLNQYKISIFYNIDNISEDEITKIIMETSAVDLAHGVLKDERIAIMPYETGERIRKIIKSAFIE